MEESLIEHTALLEHLNSLPSEAPDNVGCVIYDGRDFHTVSYLTVDEARALKPIEAVLPPTERVDLTRVVLACGIGTTERTAYLDYLKVRSTIQAVDEQERREYDRQIAEAYEEYNKKGWFTRLVHSRWFHLTLLCVLTLCLISHLTDPSAALWRIVMTAVLLGTQLVTTLNAFLNA